MGLPYEEAPGEAAFYGPKADFVVRDCIGRQWQLGTVQLDYVLPERFGLEYTGADNQPHRPVMIHRAPFGSMERFMGILIEHFAGAFPLWLAPEQVRVLPISDKFADYGRQRPERRCRRPASASTVDHRPEKIGAKIRDAQLEKIPSCSSSAPRRPRPAPSPTATASTATAAPCPWPRPSPSSRPRADSRTIRQVAAPLPRCRSRRTRGRSTRISTEAYSDAMA